MRTCIEILVFLCVIFVIVLLEINSEKKQEKQRNSNVGFVERNNNKDYNIVYRNKQTKPMTVNELFGIKPKEEKE